MAYLVDVVKHSTLIAIILLLLSGRGFSQGAPPLTVQEADGSPKKAGVSRIIVSNGTLTISGTTATINTSGSGSGLADPSANGVVVRTALGVTTARTLTGTANEISITNGNGVTGNPVFSLPSSLTFTGKTITGGTFATPGISDFSLATHSHSDVAGGGQLNASNIFNAGTVPVARLPIMIGDAGAGGTAGLVPAPAVGDATKFLRGDGTWQTIAGGGGTPGGSNGQLQFNSAGVFGGVSGATSDGTNVTFSAGALRATSPRVTTGVLDANGNSLFEFTATVSAVNGFSFTNAATGAAPILAATGPDANINFKITPKGTGFLESTGPLRLSGSGSDLWLTPQGNLVPTKIHVPVYDPGSFGQILAMGLGSGAASSARVITLADNRPSGHQPTLMLLSPDENQVFGLSWDGSNTNATITNSATGGTIIISAQAGIRLIGATLANLGSPPNGAINYCSDCNVNTDPCSGGGTGAIAYRLKNRWYCP